MGPGTQAATRRQLIARSVASAGTGLGGFGVDLRALQALGRAEQVLVATYEQALAAGVLSLPASARATAFLDHERLHLAAIVGELKRLGGTLPRAPRVLSVPSTPASDRAALGVLLMLERAALSAYYAESARLRDPHAMKIAAQIMACGAQHTTELRELLSPGDVLRAVPSAFVYGTP
jgi:hypothetical protein